jgi:hypothetical protein
VGQVGAAIGLAVLTTISTTKTAHALHRGASSTVALNRGFSDAVLIAAGMTVASLLLIVVVLSTRENRAFVTMVRAGGAPLEEVADTVAETESMASFAGAGFESELSALEHPSIADAGGSVHLTVFVA